MVDRLTDRSGDQVERRIDDPTLPPVIVRGEVSVRSFGSIVHRRDVLRVVAVDVDPPLAAARIKGEVGIESALTAVLLHDGENRSRAEIRPHRIIRELDDAVTDGSISPPEVGSVAVEIPRLGPANLPAAHVEVVDRDDELDPVSTVALNASEERVVVIAAVDAGGTFAGSV